MEKKIVIKECLSFGWETFKKRPGLFVVTTLIMFAVTASVSIVESLLGIPNDATTAQNIGSLISEILSVFMSMGIVALYLHAHDDVKEVSLKELWQPKYFWTFLGMTIVMTIAILLGFVALIIPGIILSIAFAFSGQLVIERGLGPIASLKESMRLTKGHRMSLFGLGLATLLLNFLGILVLFIGVFVTIPVTNLALVHAYRKIAGSAPEEESVLVPEPSEILAA